MTLPASSALPTVYRSQIQDRNNRICVERGGRSARCVVFADSVLNMGHLSLQDQCFPLSFKAPHSSPPFANSSPQPHAAQMFSDTDCRQA